MKKIRYLLVLATLLAISISPATLAANPNENSVIGSWDGFGINNLGQEVPGLITYHGDGTLVVTASDVATSNGHGRWEKTGPRAFAATSRAYIFDQDGQAFLKVTLSEEINVGDDGQNLESQFVAEIRLLEDGTLVNTITGTFFATRINVE